MKSRPKLLSLQLRQQSPSRKAGLTKDFGYFRLYHASAMFAETERDERRIWSTKEYFSAFGNVFVISNISKANWYES